MAVPSQPRESPDPAGPERLAQLNGIRIGPAPADIQAKIAAEIPGPGDLRDVGIGVLTDLLRIEARPDRFRRLLRIWEGKAASAIRSRDLETAEAWMRVLTRDPSLPSGFEADAVAAVDSLSRPDLIDELIVWLAENDAFSRGTGLLAEWGEPVVSRIVVMMEADEPPVNRRHLVDLLGRIGRMDSRLLTAYATDPRWFVVRNMAIALGRTGRLAALPALRSMLGHEDPRVRVEALRGLAAVDGEASVADMVGAFQDGDRRVRQAAVSLLRASPSPEVVPRLESVIGAGRLGAVETERLIEVVGERKDPAALAALQRLAARKGRLGVNKTIRRAARRELERRRS